MKKKNGSKNTKPSRSSDGRTFITVYLSGEEYARLKKHVERLKDKDPLRRVIGVSSFLRAEAMNAVDRSKLQP
ncbi:MAG: hypothetical protein EPN91_08630 [Salinibacterium sp.]|nr:MAG: hypothetical protein EPN91_08630 [Salinibacterium sp.]